MENQHAAVQEQEEQILADYGDQDESDGDVELNDISFSCAGSPRIPIIDGEVGDSQPIVRRDLLVELANEEQRFEFREDLENDDWWVSTYFPSASTLPTGASARLGPYNTIRLEAVSVGASRFQVSSPGTAYIDQKCYRGPLLPPLLPVDAK